MIAGLPKRIQIVFKKNVNQQILTAFKKSNNDPRYKELIKDYLDVIREEIDTS